MTRKSPDYTDNYSPPQFINLKLDVKEKRAFDEWVEANEADFPIYLDDAAFQGWKISARFDRNNNCYMASVTLYAPNTANHNCCVTSRAENVLTAMWMCIYKVLVLYADANLKSLGREETFG